jgi:hypothetical protein
MHLMQNIVPKTAGKVQTDNFTQSKSESNSRHSGPNLLLLDLRFDALKEILYKVGVVVWINV